MALRGIEPKAEAAGGTSWEVRGSAPTNREDSEEEEEEADVDVNG